MQSITSHNTYIIVVHPLLGYIHKDLALGYFIMIIMHLQRRALTTLPRHVRSIWGRLYRTRLLYLWSNPEYLPSLILYSSTTYKIGSYSNILHEYYYGSPPPGLLPQRFGSWLFYYGSSVFLAPHAYNSPPNWVRSMWDELDCTRLYSLRSNPQIYLPSYLFLLNSLQNLVHTTQKPFAYRWQQYLKQSLNDNCNPHKN
jgi:hypothetical protein